MLKYQFQSAIVISSNSHMRRVKVLFERTVKNNDIQLAGNILGFHGDHAKKVLHKLNSE